MNFTPKTEEELQAEFLLPNGTYDFQVMKAEDKISKSGNEMIVLTLKVWAQDGTERIVFDYLLSNQQFKLRHFCKVAGLLDKYENGSLIDKDCQEKCGKVRIRIQKDTTGQYQDKNSVVDYVENEFLPTEPSSAILLETQQKKAAADATFNAKFDDDIPF